VLTHLGQLTLDAILDPDRAALRRLTIAELERHPELQQMWSDTAGGEIIAALAPYLTRLNGEGRLTVADPGLTARQFAILLAADGRMRSLHGLRPVAAADRRKIAQQTAALIIRASHLAHGEEGLPH
jgi:TetR/AcrR family transcriptional repressor of mexJK operon